MLSLYSISLNACENASERWRDALKKKRIFLFCDIFKIFLSHYRVTAVWLKSFKVDSLKNTNGSTGTWPPVYCDLNQFIENA